MAILDDREALQKIYSILQHDRHTNWSMPDEFAYKYAHELVSLSPLLALQKADDYIEEVRQHNLKEDAKYKEAVKFKEELKEHPITNAGQRGIRGYFHRQFLAFLNGTLNSLAWLEVTEKGLLIYQPFATVSQRTITQKDLKENKVVLSVNPPAYLDGVLGTLKQFRRDVRSPWGEIVVYEPGSGRNVASAIAYHPDEKVKQIKVALEMLHRVENRYEKYKRLPRLVDLLIYYDVERWKQIVGAP